MTGYFSGTKSLALTLTGERSVYVCGVCVGGGAKQRLKAYCQAGVHCFIYETAARRANRWRKKQHEVCACEEEKCFFFSQTSISSVQVPILLWNNCLFSHSHQPTIGGSCVCKCVCVCV